MLTWEQRASAIHGLAAGLLCNDFVKFKALLARVPELQGVFQLRGASIQILDADKWSRIAADTILRAREDALHLAAARGVPPRVLDQHIRRVAATLPYKRRLRLTGIITENATADFSPPRLHEALTKYWAPLFAASPTDTHAQDEILNHTISPFPRHLIPELNLDLIGLAVRGGTFAAPGPDGIPGWIWSRFALLAVRLLFACARFIALGGEVPADTNLAFLVWIPKAEVVTGEAGVASAPGDLRPISLKNASSKILWKVFAIAVRDGLAAWISEEQRGFVKRRRPAASCLLLDAYARLVSIRHPRGALVSLDFQTAFPSVAQTWISKVLHSCNLPSWVAKLGIASMEQSAFLAIDGTPLFPVTAGVGQCCTASSSLFLFAI